ncbi:guanosine-5'-triphosphate,3'-diphosphate pyrophosphatase [mine drainage metagenome]|uniref:Guanosine-5'-triphosphate,3'-diphosphate pyrophosphatase n=1 Tax=mine drainage metagenome TaxID=410659 RepID=A0A1J5NVW0_9ZZZZ
MQRGWDCLARFGQRLAGLSASQVRAVATQTLREAHNRDEFLEPAVHLLGFPIEVISGQEEACLIYQGVAQALPSANQRRLVIDIGGRSTDLIVGVNAQAGPMASYPVGSVLWSMRFFPDGQFSEAAFAQAEAAAQHTLAPAQSFCSSDQWDICYGSAGTVNAVVDALCVAGWPAGLVSRAGLDWLLQELLAAQTVSRLNLSGMREDRKAIIGGGLSILRALFDLLQITCLEQAAGGLRHGLLAQLRQQTQCQKSESLTV